MAPYSYLSLTLGFSGWLYGRLSVGAMATEDIDREGYDVGAMCGPLVAPPPGTV